jgi:hypothetical protein
MIEVGDIVNVHFVRSDSLFSCEVVGNPCAEGDSWSLIDRHVTVHRVMMFERMDLVEKRKGGKK